MSSLQVECDEQQVLRVRRRCLWEDSLRFFQRNKSAIEKQLTVNFIGESAADAGGPRREYFMLLMNYIICQSGLLEGIDGHQVFTFNPVLLHEKTY